MEGCVISEKRGLISLISLFSQAWGIHKMSFLEMTKLHLARQENGKPAARVRILDGHFVKRIIWKSEKAVVFQDSEGHFWRYLHDYRRSEPAVIRAKSN